MTPLQLLRHLAAVLLTGVISCILLAFSLTNSGAVEPQRNEEMSGCIYSSAISYNHPSCIKGQSIGQIKKSAWYAQTLKHLCLMNLPDTAASWRAECNVTYASLGNPVASAGDVNGDGYMDVMIGALGYRPYPGGITGSVFIYYGSNKGLSDTVSTIISLQGGQLIQRTFGITIACVGDINGDGYDDVLIGDSNADRYAADVYLFYGSASGLSTSYTLPFRSYIHPSFAGELTVAGAGDVNRDGFSDVIIRAYQIEYPSPSNPIPVQRTFYRTYVYYGSASGLTGNWVQEGGNASSTVTGAGDVNKDGYDDIIISNNSQTGIGTASLYLGSSAGLGITAASTVQGSQAGEGFGGSLACAGDVNRDGYSDVIIGAASWATATAPVIKGAGRVYLYLGSSSGLGNAPVWTAEGSQANENFGISLAGAGDVNGDGYADIIVGASQYTNGDSLEGAAFIYRGSPAGLAKEPAWMAEGNQVRAYFGRSVAGVGDVNRDGIGDVIVGVPNYSHGQLSEGAAFVYAGKVEAPLPLQLIQFNAQLTGNKTTLRWTTSNENGTRYFEVQRSVDGKNFGPVAKANCKGAPGGSFYTITDELAFTGTLYYRLKIVDADQQFTYSDIVMLRNTKENVWEITPTLLTRGQSYMLGINNTEDKKPVTLQVIDINGRVQLQQNLMLTKGYQTFAQRLDLPKGYYIIRLTGLVKEAASKRILVE